MIGAVRLAAVRTSSGSNLRNRMYCEPRVSLRLLRFFTYLSSVPANVRVAAFVRISLIARPSRHASSPRIAAAGG